VMARGNGNAYHQSHISIHTASSHHLPGGAPPVLLVNHALRPLLSRFLRRSLPQLVVLSNLELSDNRHIRMTATIGGK
ncbi:hypothetical protein, partial [Pseudomonas aeruginosa]|uniref:hypothetical protein n=1 Tax=Pseudomonas aeruginosa TaxID=287 RepID=UPI0031B7B828